MKRFALILLAVAVVMTVAAPAAVAQCGCCGHHRGSGWGPGPQGGPGPGAAANRGFQRGGPMYDPDTVTTLSGKVLSVDVEPAGRGRMGGTHVTLQAGEKKTEVHLGPTWFLEEQGLAVAEGETLAVTGSLVTAGETTYLIAREVKKGDKALTLRNADGIPAWSRGPRR